MLSIQVLSQLYIKFTVLYVHTWEYIYNQHFLLWVTELLYWIKLVGDSLYAVMTYSHHSKEEHYHSTAQSAVKTKYKTFISNNVK